MGLLVRHIVRFGRELRQAGVGVTRVQVTQFMQALTHVSLADRDAFRDAARCTLVSRRDELAAFERVFARFWGGGAHRRPEASGALPTHRQRPRPAAAEATLLSRRPPPPPEPARDEARPRAIDRALSFSAAEILKRKRFDELSDEELAALQRLMQRFAWRIPDRRTRRYRPSARGPQLDRRRTLTEAIRHDGEWITRRWQQRARVPRPVVVIADISGSMARYTRLLLTFFHAITQQGAQHGQRQRVETFLFGTRLTPITHHLATRDIHVALAEVSRGIVDWAGGTRIGESLRAFNRTWARRVLGRGAMVIIVSDGWDRGDPALIGREMARLQRSCSRLVWLHPLMGTRDFAPRTRGLVAALPYVDDFLPADNLASLDALTRHLERLSPRPSPRIAGRPVTHGG